MKSTYLYKDPVTNLVLYKKPAALNVEYFVFLEKAILDGIFKKGIPVYSELQAYTRNNQIIDPSKTDFKINKQGVNQTKTLLIPFVNLENRTGSDEVALEGFMPMFEYLKNAGYQSAYTGRGGGKYSRFKKKGFYQPKGEHIEVMSCDNGLTFYAEKSIADKIGFSVAISDDIEKIEYRKFKEFKTRMMGTPFEYMGKIFMDTLYFMYTPAEQYFYLQTNIDYNDYASNEKEIKFFAEKICDLSKEFYPVKAAAAPVTNQRQAIEEQIEATKLSLQYSQYMSEEEVANLNEYLGTLELTLKYI
jgi:hypothetical protein